MASDIVSRRTETAPGGSLGLEGEVRAQAGGSGRSHARPHAPGTPHTDGSSEPGVLGSVLESLRGLGARLEDTLRELKRAAYDDEFDEEDEDPHTLKGRARALVRRLAGRTEPRARGLRTARPPFGLQWRILFVNFFGLILFMGGVIFLNQYRTSLIDERIEALRTHSEIIAGAIAEYAVPQTPRARGRERAIDLAEANKILRRTMDATGYRIRLYDVSGATIADSYWLSSDGKVRARPIRPPGTEEDHDWDFVGRVVLGIREVLSGETIGRYREAEPHEPGTVYSEVAEALVGETDPERLRALRQTEQGNLMLSVATPVQRFKRFLGVVLITTEGDDIDKVAAKERQSVYWVFVAAVGLTIALTVLMAMTVTGPIKRLAEAADRVRRQKGPVTAGFHAEIPMVGTRYDEIGILSESLREMTGALEKRIDAIARFAADVAHELKNPLTSLASAVESLPIAPEGPGRERLVEIIQHDVKRLDRLITDISAASRLDAELSRGEAHRLDIAFLLRGLVDIERDTRREREAEVVLEVDTGSLPGNALSVRGIESRLGQVFTNIIENALSFSPADGTVRVRATLDQTREGRFVKVSVEDDGPGIPDGNLERIFERFYTERPEAEDFGKNSGLGLSISRQIVEAHGGRIYAQNRPGPDGSIAGARIVVELPARRVKGA